MDSPKYLFQPTTSPALPNAVDLRVEAVSKDLTTKTMSIPVHLMPTQIYSGCNMYHYETLERFPFTWSERSGQYFESTNDVFKKDDHLKIVGLDIEKIILIFDLNMKPRSG